MVAKRIKGCFSTRIIKELNLHYKVWQPSFFARPVRDGEAFRTFAEYIRLNPLKANFVSHAAEWKFGSASGMFEVAPSPSWVKDS